MTRRASLLLVPILALCGCSGLPDYRWTSRVPEEIRTVAVPVFENRTASAELGPIAAQYTLREFQREGTFAVRRPGDSSLEVQGVLVRAERRPVSFDRGYGMRAGEYRYFVTAEVSLIDKDGGKVLADRRVYKAETTFLVQGDLLTGERGAAQRIAADLARQIVDDVVSFPYNKR